MNFYVPYVAVLWLTSLSIDYVDASLDPADLAAIVADDVEASGCTEDARGTCVEQFTDGNQDVCSSLMTFYNCALTSVRTTPECTANAVVTEYVQTIEKLMIHSAYLCASENDCDSVFQVCFRGNKDEFDSEFTTGEVDAVQQLTYSEYTCYLLTDVVHCLYLQQDIGCYPWLSDVTFEKMTNTIANRCPDVEHLEAKLWLPPPDDSQDSYEQCMSHVKSCEIAFYKSGLPEDSLSLCSASMRFFECLLEDIHFLSTGCKANPHVMNFIDVLRQTRLVFGLTCATNIVCSNSSYDTCMGDQISVFEDSSETDVDDIVYTDSICSALRRSVYCLDVISSGCTNDWLPSSAVEQMSADLTAVSCAMEDIPPSLRSSPATIPRSTSEVPGSTWMLAVVTIILCFVL